MPLLAIGMMVLGLVVGFVVGMVMFQRSLRWCPTCGAGLRCVECRDRARCTQTTSS